jgi:hypothetical protein
MSMIFKSQTNENWLVRRHVKKTCFRASLFMEVSKPSMFLRSFSRSSSRSELVIGRYLVRYPPVVEPLQVAILAVWSHHSPTDWHEQNIESNGRSIQQTIDGVLHALDLIAQYPVGNEAKVKNGEVKSWVVVVHISDTSHSDEWQVVQEPTKDRIKRRVVNLIDVSLLQVLITTLPSHEVPCYHDCDYSKGSRGEPVDQRISKKEIFDDRVVPSAHAEAYVENRPLPELRSQIVLLVWIWDKGIVRGHHSHVQMNEILEERRLVGSSIGRGYCDVLEDRTRTCL